MLHYVTTEFAGSQGRKRELITRFYNLDTKKLGQSQAKKNATVTDFLKDVFNKESSQMVSREVTRGC